MLASKLMDELGACIEKYGDFQVKLGSVTGPNTLFAVYNCRNNQLGGFWLESANDIDSKAELYAQMDHLAGEYEDLEVDEFGHITDSVFLNVYYANMKRIGFTDTDMQRYLEDVDWKNILRVCNISR